jgi:hypothetical protein
VPVNKLWCASKLYSRGILPSFAGRDDVNRLFDRDNEKRKFRLGTTLCKLPVSLLLDKSKKFNRFSLDMDAGSEYENEFLAKLISTSFVMAPIEGGMLPCMPAFDKSSKVKAVRSPMVSAIEPYTCPPSLYGDRLIAFTVDAEQLTPVQVQTSDIGISLAHFQDVVNFTIVDMFVDLTMPQIALS